MSGRLGAADRKARRADPFPDAAQVVPLKRRQARSKDYLDFFKSLAPARASLKGLTLVVDCSNGSLSKIAPAFLRSLGIRVIAVGSTPNGKNINAGWGSQHPEKMQKIIRQKKPTAAWLLTATPTASSSAMRRAIF